MSVKATVREASWRRARPTGSFRAPRPLISLKTESLIPDGSYTLQVAPARLLDASI